MITVLLVDDSPTVRSMVSDLLRSKGLQVVEACDGIEAIEKIQAKCPDLVITDIVMPRMNGYELCRWVKTNLKERNIPVLMCTSKSEQFDHYWGLKQGADAYITKPFQPADLIQTIKKLLKKVPNQ
ncbi:response regulator [Aerosakkonema funiforme]|uniref:Response regulator n=1 Tax=Aerosakkonema funiforme FACHB-1375 TaxID=2949571 RepID=A0A926VG98_9CYAN|nr:response regulator [Aerosakkonema funiforme]MBD2182598.1 response regulator [Aerosakkonema funiforme FACHB-1375]